MNSSSQFPAMKLLLVVAALLSLLLSPALTDEGSCTGRCDEGFNSQKKCQCDRQCIYYQSCCFDYSTVCDVKVTRGDVFGMPDDEYIDFNETIEFPSLMPSFKPETQTEEIKELVPTELTSEKNPEPVSEIVDLSTEIDLADPTVSGFSEQEEGNEMEDLCSGKPFDAFTDLKNGSIYAFRGKFFYELDEKSVLPGYPKIIKDVWGIDGPVDAAFTRINCKGRTYLFKGNEYWRFDNGVLDPGYPRNISEGFKNIPNNVNAAFALPARNYNGRERVYFFKGNRYWQYSFKNQPSRKDCEGEPPSIVFEQYASLQLDPWQDFFQILYGDFKHGADSKSRFISKDWKGLPSGIDAAVAGRIYISPRTQRSSRRTWRRKSLRNRKRYQRKRFPSWSHFWTWQSEEDDDYLDPDWTMPVKPSCQPIQSAYFFKKDKYYRVNLKTKRVDSVWPRYPRSIAQYWLGCKDTVLQKK